MYNLVLSSSIKKFLIWIKTQTFDSKLEKLYVYMNYSCPWATKEFALTASVSRVKITVGTPKFRPKVSSYMKASVSICWGNASKCANFQVEFGGKYLYIRQIKNYNQLDWRKTGSHDGFGNKNLCERLWLLLDVDFKYRMSKRSRRSVLGLRSEANAEVP